jgi:hypothetical protein
MTPTKARRAITPDGLPVVAALQDLAREALSLEGTRCNHSDPAIKAGEGADDLIGSNTQLHHE